MSEEQKYQGALYKEKNNNKNKKQKTGENTNTSTAGPSQTMAQPAYVEDYEEWREYEVHSDDGEDDGQSPDLPPEAPTPPSANNADVNVNVFDFLVANATPTASKINLARADGAVQLSQDTQLVRFDYEANGGVDALIEVAKDEDALVQYGTGPVPTSFETPAPKAARKKVKDGDKDVKKDKKRKRLHIETDQIMTDAPPVLHTGLTGGLNRMMSRPAPGAFPPSPDYSGGDVADTPASPLKKSKHSKQSRSTGGIGNSLMAMIAPPTKVKSKKKKSSSSSPKKHRSRLEAPKDQKLIEFRPSSKDAKDANGSSQMIIYKPRAEHFLSFVNKGPESERGCSVNKVLKRYHRERNATSQSAGKLVEEKELFRALRVRKNERGEIVLFCA